MDTTELSALQTQRTLPSMELHTNCCPTCAPASAIFTKFPTTSGAIRPRFTSNLRAKPLLRSHILSAAPMRTNTWRRSCRERLPQCCLDSGHVPPPFSAKGCGEAPGDMGRYPWSVEGAAKGSAEVRKAVVLKHAKPAPLR